MSRTGVVVGLVVLLVLVGAGAGAAVLGPLSGVVDDLPGGTSDADPTAAPDSDPGGGSSGGDTDGSNDGSGDGGADATPTEPEPFGIEIVSIEECGETCRDVTIEVSNRLNDSAAGVDITSRIYAGKRSDDGDKLWEGSAELGTIAGQSSETVESRVKLGFVDAAKVKNNDGWITVRTTVTAGDVEATYVEEKKVA